MGFIFSYSKSSETNLPKQNPASNPKSCACMTRCRRAARSFGLNAASCASHPTAPPAPSRPPHTAPPQVPPLQSLCPLPPKGEEVALLGPPPHPPPPRQPPPPPPLILPNSPHPNQPPPPMEEGKSFAPGEGLEEGAAGVWAAAVAPMRVPRSV